MDHFVAVSGCDERQQNRRKLSTNLCKCCLTEPNNFLKEVVQHHQLNLHFTVSQRYYQY